LRALVQRVSRAQVTVEGVVTGAIGPGLVVFLGVTHGDSATDAAKLAHKVFQLRCFNDDAGAMNKSLADTGGAALVVSQFTLYGDTAKGNRPSFVQAAPAADAEAGYRAFLGGLEALGASVAAGVFRAHMDVELVNDGPVTLLIETGPSAAADKR